MSDRELESFLLRLSRLRLPGTTNPYDRSREGLRRRENLRHYLAHFRPPNACDILLVAEACGYRGGRVTGVPLTSEAVVREDIHFRRSFPRLAASYEDCREPGALHAEATASIVWRVFAELGADATDPRMPPCCWNIVPVHPYDPAKGPWSNRPPTRAEIALGREYCRELIALLRPRRIVAVGKCAVRGLTDAGIDHLGVRHPSQGGARLFRRQLIEIAEAYPCAAQVDTRMTAVRVSCD